MSPERQGKKNKNPSGKEEARNSRLASSSARNAPAGAPSRESPQIIRVDQPKNKPLNAALNPLLEDINATAGFKDVKLKRRSANEEDVELVDVEDPHERPTASTPLPTTPTATNNHPVSDFRAKKNKVEQPTKMKPTPTAFGSSNSMNTTSSQPMQLTRAPPKRPPPEDLKKGKQLWHQLAGVPMEIVHKVLTGGDFKSPSLTKYSFKNAKGRKAPLSVAEDKPMTTDELKQITRKQAGAEARKQRRATRILPVVVEHLTQVLRSALEYRRKLKGLMVKLFILYFHLAMLLFLIRTPTSYSVVSSLEEAMRVRGLDVQNPSLELGENPVFDWLDTVGQRIWTDPVCGNGVCEPPYEFPAYETLGCQVDCGQERDLQEVIVVVTTDFTQIQTKLDMATVMARATWNVCKDTPLRRDAGLDDICIYENDQRFELPISTFQQSYELKRDNWYVRVSGDYFGLVGGRVLTVVDGLVEDLDVYPTWETCEQEDKNVNPLTAYVTG
uniref:Uncharacterized protein n=1 Tax=Pyramimonas obovata TaxID=1411642 RepID=A0A7S0R4F4_9CHLO|mmetsp:Transcript_2534/g.5273  ORF Transcript_2534/g.5273 Transcript_2534/m.5273 type:complete len:500 (+) Transcript_2534:202-1701(+)|eukprot:CAMPEP_0118928162 /NCGR_PEP_ID=MMETSP1169-20130426/5480_1 /TAXON_ID=36882 /ORGANISM="Pyramimonas obovata, Strain CCMP722" /LENGTH=499 /DNA_ID=CAMNT_0006870079 /DNA_START=174 /DNA_END=1673 /DNA_ORIENTATION=-